MSAPGMLPSRDLIFHCARLARAPPAISAIWSRHIECFSYAMERHDSGNSKQESIPKGGEGAPAKKRSASKAEEGAATAKSPPKSPQPWPEPRGIQKGIADADKIARSGSTEETVRDTPPAGAWNDTSED